ncbi:hypothetical protein HMI56_007146 [Coelomomyces lativittatus]|nr:hypothetical protein HMI56_007146 [Coelomomyces lativittatus]
MATTTTTSPKLTNSSTSLPSHLNYCSSSSSSSSSFIALSKLVPGTDGSFWHQLQQQLTPFHSKFIGDQTDGKENSYSLTFGTPQLQAISILFHHFIESNPFELNALLKKNEIEYGSIGLYFTISF